MGCLLWIFGQKWLGHTEIWMVYLFFTTETTVSSHRQEQTYLWAERLQWTSCTQRVPWIPRASSILQWRQWRYDWDATLLGTAEPEHWRLKRQRWVSDDPRIDCCNPIPFFKVIFPLIPGADWRTCTSVNYTIVCSAPSHYLNHCVKWVIGDKFNQHTRLKCFENVVCKMLTVLLRPQYAKQMPIPSPSWHHPPDGPPVQARRRTGEQPGRQPRWGDLAPGLRLWRHPPRDARSLLTAGLAASLPGRDHTAPPAQNCREWTHLLCQPPRGQVSITVTS